MLRYVIMTDTGRVVNGDGQEIDVDQLFSPAKNDEAKEFFTRHRRQALAMARPKGQAIKQAASRLIIFL